MTISAGQEVYWVDEERPPGEHAAVTVSCGRYVSASGDRAAVWVGTMSIGRMVFPLLSALHTDAATATQWAYGRALGGLVRGLGYKSVTVTDHLGRSDTVGTPQEGQG